MSFLPSLKSIRQRNFAIKPTGATVTAGGLAISTSCGSFSTGSTSATDVTNLSVTIDTLGNPVILALVPDTSGGAAASVAAVSQLEISIVRGSTTIALTQVGNVQTGCVVFCDFPAAGTYTYKVTGRCVSGGDTMSVSNMMLAAYELP